MQHLVRAPGTRVRQDLALAQAAIGAAFPLKTAHKKTLPYSIQELSQLLTAERAQIQGYWQKPSLTGAYMYYFLPWNLLRLSWLMPSLKLELPAGSRVLDLGSGPLTMPLGLWISHPELRETPLSVICADPAQRPMELGRSVLDNLSAQPGKKSPWDVQLMRAPIDIALRKTGKVRLITAGNVLNEISPKQERLEERLEDIFFSMDRILEPGGQILLMEPGTRLGGKLISLLRRIALEEGYAVEAPCTHEALCPYAPIDLEDEDDTPAQKRKTQPFTRQPSGWCHFTLSPDGAPAELMELSRAAHLEKERLSFSCLLLKKPKEESAVRQSAKEKAVPGGVLTPVRVVSDAIRLPQEGDTGRYVCSRHGIGLLHHAYEFKSGMFVEALLPDKGGKDLKSGAHNMEPFRRDNNREKGTPTRRGMTAERQTPQGGMGQTRSTAKESFRQGEGKSRQPGYENPNFGTANNERGRKPAPDARRGQGPAEGKRQQSKEENSWSGNPARGERPGKSWREKEEGLGAKAPSPRAGRGKSRDSGKADGFKRKRPAKPGRPASGKAPK